MPASEWLVCSLLADLDLWKRLLFNCSITIILPCPLFLCKISSSFRENNNVVVFPFPFHIFMLLSNLWFILRTRNFPDLYLLICLPRRLLALSRDRFLIPRFIRSLCMLAFYDVAHFLPLGGTGRDFPFAEDETWRHFSYSSGRELQCLNRESNPGL